MTPQPPTGAGWGMGLVVAAVALAAPGPAYAAIDLYFETRQGRGQDGGPGLVEGRIHATNFDGTVIGPSGCNPVLDCRTGPNTMLRVERGGQIVAQDGPSPKPGVFITPQAGDMVHLGVGASESVVTYNGRPAIDGDCLPSVDHSVSGSFSAVQGATVQVNGAGNPGVNGQQATEAATVTTTSDRFTASFGHELRPPLTIVEQYGIPGADGATITVHAQRSILGGCDTKLVPIRVTKLATPDPVRVKADGRFAFGRRVKCPAELPFCRISADTYVARNSGNTGPKLGRLRYSVPAGSSAMAKARLGPSALRKLKRGGKTKVYVLLIVRPPAERTPGLQAPEQKSVVRVTVAAPRKRAS